jgi:hypothetical protein
MDRLALAIQLRRPERAGAHGARNGLDDLVVVEPPSKTRFVEAPAKDRFAVGLQFAQSEGIRKETAGQVAAVDFVARGVDGDPGEVGVIEAERQIGCRRVGRRPLQCLETFAGGGRERLEAKGCPIGDRQARGFRCGPPVARSWLRNGSGTCSRS